jgi:hypothetical protein
MIVDIPEGLPIPMVSSPPTSVPEWNFNDKNFMAMVSDFGSSFINNNGVLLLFHQDNLKLRVDIRGYSKAYHFSILKEWTGINRLPITITNLVICIILLDTCISNLYVVDYIPCYIHL